MLILAMFDFRSTQEMKWMQHTIDCLYAQ